MKKIEFANVFSTEMEEYVELKRRLGYKYETAQELLRRLDRRLQGLGVTEKTITKEICDKLCAREEGLSFKTQANRIGVLKGFCRYLASLGYAAHIPAASQLGKDPRFTPHIYTDDELRSFFTVVDRIRMNARSPYRH